MNALLFLLLFILTGCGSGEISSKLQIEGAVLTGEYQLDTLVCLDTNNNFQCDDLELQTRTDSTGEFLLNIPKDSSFPTHILALISYKESDTISGNSVSYILRSVVEEEHQKVFISPFSSLEAYLYDLEPSISLEEHRKTLSTIFKDEAQLLSQDYLSDKNSDLTALAKIYIYTYLFIQKEQNLLENQTSLHMSVNKKILDNASYLTYQTKLFQENRDDISDAPLLLQENIGVMLSEWQQGMDFGQGYNVLKELPIQGSSCVKKKENITPNINCSQKNSYEFKMVQETQEVLNTMNISAKASLNVIVAKAHGSIEKVDRLMEKENKLYILITQTAQECSYQYDTTAFELTPTAKENYKKDYQLFRERCGDGFLAMVESGGRFNGLFQLDYKNSEHKEEIVAALKAKVLGATVYSKEFKDKVNTLLQEFNARYWIDSTTLVMENYSTTSDDFFLHYTDFLTHLNGDECNSENGLNSCKYLAYYYDYGVIDNAYASKSANASAILDNYGEYGVAYDVLTRNIDYIAMNPDFFPFFKNIEEVKTAIQINKGVLKLNIDNCETNTSLCIQPQSIQDLGTVQDMIEQYNIPDTEFIPYQSCAEIKKDNPSLSLNDQIYLYAERNISKWFKVTCSENLVTFLPLVHHETQRTEPISFFRYNYGIAEGLQLGGNATNYTLTNFYDSFEIEPCSNLGECFTIVSAPVYEQITPTLQNHGVFYDFNHKPINYLLPGNAISSNNTNTSTEKLMANITLTDTPFFLDTNSFEAKDGIRLEWSKENQVLNIFLNAKAVTDFNNIQLKYK